MSPKMSNPIFREQLEKKNPQLFFATNEQGNTSIACPGVTYNYTMYNVQCQCICIYQFSFGLPCHLIVNK